MAYVTNITVLKNVSPQLLHISCKHLERQCATVNSMTEWTEDPKQDTTANTVYKRVHLSTVCMHLHHQQNLSVYNKSEESDELTSANVMWCDDGELIPMLSPQEVQVAVRTVHNHAEWVHVTGAGPAWAPKLQAKINQHNAPYKTWAHSPAISVEQDGKINITQATTTKRNRATNVGVGLPYFPDKKRLWNIKQTTLNPICLEKQDEHPEWHSL